MLDRVTYRVIEIESVKEWECESYLNKLQCVNGIYWKP